MSSNYLSKQSSDYPYDSWEDVYKRHDLYELPWDQPEINLHLKKLLKHSESKEAKALDLGCGTGTTSRYLSDLGYRVEAWDISHTALERAEKLSREYEKNISYHCGNALQEAFSERSAYDLVLDLFFLHHVQDKDVNDYFNGIKSVLKTKGKYIVGVLSQVSSDRQRHSQYCAGQVNYWSMDFIEKKFEKKIENYISGCIYTEIEKYPYNIIIIHNLEGNLENG